jgi:HPt (histidine-containing phosphotransfer) domain-containing protein
MPQHEHLDLAEFCRRTGSENLFHLVAEGFSRNLPVWRARMQQGLEEGQQDAVEDVLHSMKSSCGMLSASVISTQIARTEVELRAHGLAARRREVEAVMREIDALENQVIAARQLIPPAPRG